MSPLRWLLDLIYPPKCVFCGKLLQPEETDLCRACRSGLAQVEQPVRRGEHFDCCHCVYYYEAAVVDSIHRFKFGGMEQYAEAYGRLLAMHLLENQVHVDLLTWVPVSAKRKRKRGYDQSLLLAQAVGRELGVPCVRTLEKILDNPPQSTRSGKAERRGNVINVYRCADETLVQNRHILLIDDIITTGATLSECSRILKTAGAAQITCAALAATRNSDRKNSR